MLETKREKTTREGRGEERGRGKRKRKREKKEEEKKKGGGEEGRVRKEETLRPVDRLGEIKMYKALDPHIS